MRTPAAIVVLFLAAIASARAVDLALDSRAIEEAIAVGRSTIERDRTRFHAGYRLIVGRAPVDYVDIVTPFRRVALEAQLQARIGNRTFGQRQAMDLLAAYPDWIAVVVELTFHPLNALASVPPYDVTLRSASGATIRPRGLDRIPRFGPRVEGMPLPVPGRVIRRGSEPMLGGTLLASFEGRQLEKGATYELVVAENGKDVTRVRVGLGGMR